MRAIHFILWRHPGHGFYASDRGWLRRVPGAHLQYISHIMGCWYCEHIWCDTPRE